MKITAGIFPPCDITPCGGSSGEPCSVFNGKGRDITNGDLIKAAAVKGVTASKVKLIIEQTEGVLPAAVSNA